MSNLSNIEQFIEYLAEAVIIVNSASDIVFSNGACTELLGYKTDELRNKKIDVLLEAEYRQGHPDLIKTYVEARSEPKRMMSRDVLHCIKSDGTVFPVRISISTMDIDGEFYGIALIQDQTTYMKQISLIESQAITDPLTLLYNRRYLEKILQPGNRWLESHPSIGVLYLDLIDFKKINDSYGHDCGDVVLKTVAIRMKETFRNNDLIFRVGGDEFLILIDLVLGSNGRETISMLAKKLHENLRRKIPLTNGAIHTDASVGAGIYPDDFGDIEIMTKLADRAMYRSKQNKEDIFFVSDLPTQIDKK